MKKVAFVLAAFILGLSLTLTFPIKTYSVQEDKITICHAAGQDDTLHFETLTLSPNAVYQDQGEGGHFYENGTPKAGHEHDYLGACEGDEVTPTPTPDPTATPTPTPTPEPECEVECEEVTPTPTPEPTATPTPTPTPEHKDVSDGRSDGKSDGRSSCPECTQPPKTGDVLGASTDWAGTGAVEDLIVNAIGVLGGLSTAAGIALAKRKSN